MKIADLAVERPQFTLVIFAMALALGIYSFRTIPRSEDPQFPIAVFQVVAIYPGATPTDLEQLVVDPVEDEINELDDIKNVKTRIFDSVAVILVEFEPDVDPDEKHQAVLRQVGEVRADLPDDLHSLDVRRYSTTNVSVAQMALTSRTAPYRTLQAQAERLEERLEALPGVKRSETWGVPDEQVRIALDVGKLGQLGLSVDRVLQALASDNTNLPGGSVDVGGKKLNVKATGPYRSIDQVKGTVVGGDGQSVVHLGDVADVTWDYAAVDDHARHNGVPAVFVTVTQKEGENVFDVAGRIQAEADAFAAQLPAGIALERGFDQSKNVANRLDHLYRDFAIAILLVLVTLIPLGMRASLIVMVSIPLSLAIGLALLHAAGYGLNQLSIVGFVIALGLLVDDSIVVVENITRHLREGASRRDAAVRATRQIAVAVLGCTAALVFAFVPLLFLPGTPGDFIRSLPVAVILTILASLLVSLTIVPFLASAVLKREEDERGNLVLRGFRRAIEVSYRPVLRWSLAHPRATLAGGAVLLAGSLALVPSIGFSLFPKAGLPQFIVSIETPDGSSLSHTDAAVRHVEEALAAHPEVEWTMANIGKGNPQVYYNFVPAPERSSVSEVLVQLRAYDPRTSPALIDRLRDELDDWPGAEIRVVEFENGPPIDAPIAIRILGDDLEVLRRLSAQVTDLIEATPGTMYVNDPMAVRRTDLLVDVDRDRAGLHGVPTARVAQMVRLGLAGLDAGTLRDDDGEEYDLSVELRGVERNDPRAFDLLTVPSVTGRELPLPQVARLSLVASPTSIQHHDRQRAVTVTSHVKSGFNTDRVTRQVLAGLERVELPRGYRFVAAGEIESRKQSFGGLGAAILVAVFIIFAILVLEFGSFRGTLVVASVIPLGVIGGLVLLFLTGNTLSFTAMIGFVALVGIEIKNSILLVDFTNQLRDAGESLDDAIQKAGEVRFLPIVLTTLTAVGGLMPLALSGSALYSPLAWVIIGGLISSTLLSRLVTPVLYKLLAPRARLTEVV
ncbi:MAG TPA: efflux RND transporter permease subunit [Kofleriaceae bacterium]|nr:efflux RND transporter permease subunit [Kofleriaceae bacterium]